MRERKPVSMKVDVGARAVVGSGMAKRAEENAAEENADGGGRRADETRDVHGGFLRHGRQIRGIGHRSRWNDHT